MHGMNSYSPKARRAQRRRSHIAKDLRTSKYGQRRVEDKKKQIRGLTHNELVKLINSPNIEDDPFYKESPVWPDDLDRKE